MSESITLNREDKLCAICNQKESKYRCPRCEILYCSLDCYKSENHANCSESFYRDCVNEELTNNYADDETRQRTIDMLNRLNEEDEEDIRKLLEDDDLELGSLDSDDEEILSLHDRLQKVDLDDPNAIWNALTQDERNEFESSVNQDDIDVLIPQWQPWWLYRKKESLIVENVESTAEAHKEEEEALKRCPALVKVPKFSTICTVEPSSAIRYNIANVLAAYVFLLRYFNGEPEPIEVAILLLTICANLDNNTNFDKPGTASESVAQRCLQSTVIHTNEASLNVMKHDTIKVLLGPSQKNKAYYCKAALSHIHQILTEAKQMETSKSNEDNPKSDKNSNDNEFSKKFPEHNQSYLAKLDISKVKKCIKKIEYYISYVESREHKQA